MKLPSVKVKVEAFTLVELLVIIFVIVIIAAYLLPSLAGRPRRPYQAVCLNNQKQIAIGLLMWKEDHNGQFPWQISTNENGTMEYAGRGYAAPNFEILCDNNYLKWAGVFVCPSDKARNVVSNFAQFGNENLSYFVNVDAPLTNHPNSFLTGDRSLQADGQPVKPGLFILTKKSDMSWTTEIHPRMDGVAFADGHVQFVRTNDLNSFIKMLPLATNRLCIP